MKQQDLDMLILLPVGLALLAGWIGWGGPWRRVVFNLAFTFAAIIFAFQHSAFLTNLVVDQRLLRNLTHIQISATIFGVTVVISYLVFHTMYRLMWRPEFTQSSSSGWSKLFRAAMNAVSGWALGVVLIVCVLVFSLRTVDVLSVVPVGPYRDLLASTLANVLTIGDAWTPGQLPVIFRR